MRPSRAAGSTFDFVLRVAFFAIAPFGLVIAGTLFPIHGALLSVAVALGVCLFGEALQSRAATSRWVAFVLGRQLQFEAYYRAHPPRGFLYYVFYPVLFPYWLFDREARREFLLFKGYNLAGIAILVGISLYRFFTVWRPELDWGDFLPWLAKTLLFESVIVLAFLMPIATSVIALHHARHHGRLLTLLGVGLASVVAAAVPLVRRHDPIVPMEARTRVHLRTEVAPAQARRVVLDALREAWRAQEKTPARVEGDGKLEGAALDVARLALERFYRPDEAAAFDLWASPRKKPRLVVLYAEGRRGRDPLWIGLRDSGEVVRDPRLLPKGAFAAMRHAVR